MMKDVYDKNLIGIIIFMYKLLLMKSINVNILTTFIF